MIRAIATCFLLAITATGATAFEIESMSKEEEAAFREAVRAYLLDHPEVIFEAVAVYESRKAQDQAGQDAHLIAANRQEIFFDGRSWVGGNPDGDITVVEFLDYRCGYCKRAFPEVNELVATDRNIRLVVKEFPILGEESTNAARFAIATRNVAGDAAYEAVHNEFMLARGSLDDAAFARVAKRLKLDLEAITAAMSDPAVDAEIEANYALAQTLGINGTPGFVFHSEMLRGYAPLDAMREIVDRVRG